MLSPVKFLASCFYQYGLFVGRHPIPFALLPLFVGIVLSCGIIFKTSQPYNNLTFENEITSPTYLQKRERIMRQWPVQPRYPYGGDVKAMLQIRKSTNGSKNLIELENYQKIYEFIEYLDTVTSGICTLRNDFKIIVNCYNFIKHGLNVQGLPNKLSFPLHKYSRISPFSYVSLVSVFGGVQTIVYPFKDYGKIDFIESMYLSMQCIANDDMLQNTVLDYFDKYNQNKSNSLHVLYVAETINQQQSKSKSLYAIVFTIIVTAIVIVCSSLRIRVSGFPYINFDPSTPVLTFVGLLIIGLGMCASVGTSGYLSLKFNSVDSIVPFLVIWQNVGDILLMLSYWKASVTSESISQRLAICLSHCGPMITLTSLATILIFGSTVPKKAVSIFSARIVFSMSVMYVLKLTLLASTLVMLSRWKNDNCKRACIKCNPAKSSHPEEMVEKYLKVLTTVPARVTSLIVMVLYFGFAFWGIVIITREGPDYTSSSKDKRIQTFDEKRSTQYYSYGIEAKIMVENVTALSQLQTRARMVEIVHAFEDVPFSRGYEATQFWMRSYVSSYPQPRNTLKDWSYRLKRWSELATNYEALENVLTWGNATTEDIEEGCGCEKTGTVTAFTFKTIFKAFNATGTMDAASVITNVTNQFPEHKISLWLREDPTKFAISKLKIHERRHIVTHTFKTVIITTAVLTVCLAIGVLPNFISALSCTAASVSIIVGVIGFAVHWNVRFMHNSDIIVIPVIGLSLYYSTVMMYSMTSPNTSHYLKLAAAINHCGRPILVSSVSSILGMAILVSVKDLLFSSFFKTFFLTIVFGSVYSLVLLPVFMMMLCEWIDKDYADDQNGRGNTSSDVQLEEPTETSIPSN